MMRLKTAFKTFALILLVIVLQTSHGLSSDKLTVGVTLHPYYSWVANIAGDTINLQPIIPDDVDPHSYQVRPQDLENIGALDAIVVNTLGHDDYIEGMLKAAGKEDVFRITPNLGLPLIKSNHKRYSFQQGSEEKPSYNSHTYVAILGAVQQINTIADQLAALRPEYSTLYKKNARMYSKRLRLMLRDALKKLEKSKNNNLNIATVHDGYAYLLQELGVKTTAVIQPRHGIEPSARQLADTIKRIKKGNVQVLFTEVDYQKKYVDTIYDETGCRLYSLSHISNGEYSKNKFEIDMQKNLNTIVSALSGKTGNPE